MASPEDVFPGPARSAFPVLPRSPVAYTPASAREIVKHRAGYGAFADFALSHGRAPRELAESLTLLVNFCRRHSGELSTAELEPAASIFVGNMLAHSRLDAEWLGFPRGSATVGTRGTRFDAERMLRGLLAPDQDHANEFMAVIRRWIEQGA